MSSTDLPSTQTPVKYVFITGCTHGLGKYTAKTLLAKGYHVTMACRNIPLAEKYAKEFSEKANNPNVDVIPLDLSSLASVRECVNIFKSRNRPIDILINNAGMLDFTNNYTKTHDGYESHFGVNFLGPFYLTQLLIPELLKRKPALIVNVASIAHAWPYDLSDYNGEKSYGVMAAYGRSKMCQLLAADGIQRRYGDKGITAIATHPGGAATNIYNTFPWWCNWLSWCIMPSSHLVLLPAFQGAAPTIHAVTHPELWGAAPPPSQKKDQPFRTYDLYKGKVYAQYFGPFKGKGFRTEKSRDVASADKLWNDALAMISAFTTGAPPRALSSPQEEKKKQKKRQ